VRDQSKIRKKEASRNRGWRGGGYKKGIFFFLTKKEKNKEKGG
jgi:hypothetical protein